MQILKEDVRRRIRQAALHEFRIYGFKGASVRRIADSAGVSVGNLYCYFDNKEALFESLVGPVYALFSKTKPHDINLMILDINLMENLEFIQFISQTHYTYQQEFYILLEKSEGTKFADLKDLMIASIESMLTRFIEAQINVERTVVKKTFFLKAYAIGFIEGLVAIVESDDDSTTFIENLIQYTEFTLKNTMRTLIALRDGTIQFRRLSDEEIYNHFGNHCGFGNNHPSEDPE